MLGGKPSLKISSSELLRFGSEGVLKIFPQRISYQINKTKVICAGLLDFGCDLDLDFVIFEFW